MAFSVELAMFIPFLLVLHISTPFLTPVSADQQLSVASGNVTLQVLPTLVVEKSPGSKLGTKMFCERVLIQGFPRLKHLKKFPDSLKINVSHVNPSGRLHNIEVCFHRNKTIGIGMCPQGQWEKLTKGSWAKSMSPFDNKILDIRMTSPSTELLQVSVDEDFYLYRVVFLIAGIVLLTIATFLSKSLVFYYGSAMSIGILLVILVILFQGMKLLPAGRKINSLALVFYSSVIGMGAMLLRNVPNMLRAVLIEIGLGEDMYPPLVIFLLLFLVIGGAWLGFWVVRKLILDEDGDVDSGVAQFVVWSIRIIASAMILQSSLDPLLATEALIGGILISVLVNKSSPLKFTYGIYRMLRRFRKLNRRRLDESYSSPVQELRNSRPFTRSPLNYRGSTSSNTSSRRSDDSRPSTRSPLNYRGSTSTNSYSPSQQLSDSGPFYSTYHDTPERRRFSKEEWNQFTKETTKRALEGLVSSPDFGQWAAANADRLTLAPDTGISQSDNNRRRWFNLF